MNDHSEGRVRVLLYLKRNSEEAFGYVLRHRDCRVTEAQITSTALLILVEFRHLIDGRQ